LDEVNKYYRLAWKYAPEHEMFVGTTNAITVVGEDYTCMLFDLGRNNSTYHRTAAGKAVRTAAALRENAGKRALGEFLEACREDIAALLEELGKKEAA